MVISQLCLSYRRILKKENLVLVSGRAGETLCLRCSLRVAERSRKVTNPLILWLLSDDFCGSFVWKWMWDRSSELINFKVVYTILQTNWISNRVLRLTSAHSQVGTTWNIAHKNIDRRFCYEPVECKQERPLASRFFSKNNHLPTRSDGNWWIARVSRFSCKRLWSAQLWSKNPKTHSVWKCLNTFQQIPVPKTSEIQILVWKSCIFQTFWKYL